VPVSLLQCLTKMSTFKEMDNVFYISDRTSDSEHSNGGFGGRGVYEIRRPTDYFQTYKRIEWEDLGSPESSLNAFLLNIRQEFRVSDDMSFVLRDETGCIIVISSLLPPGKYDLVETQSHTTIANIIRNESEEGDSLPFFRSWSRNSLTDLNGSSSSSSSVSSPPSRRGSRSSASVEKQPTHSEELRISAIKEAIGSIGGGSSDGGGGGGAMDKNFERNLLQIACADALIANERTWLAWTRTSLNMMTVCFSFVFIDDWAKTSFSTKVVANICVFGFALAFLLCFVVGYRRYRLFAVLLRTNAFSSRLDELSVNDGNFTKLYVWYVGILFAFSSFVFLAVLRRNSIGSGGEIDTMR